MSYFRCVAYNLFTISFKIKANKKPTLANNLETIKSVIICIINIIKFSQPTDLHVLLHCLCAFRPMVCMILGLLVIFRVRQVHQNHQ